MAQPPVTRLIHTLRKTSRSESDQDLLGRFLRNRDDEAFRALVTRHGKTVLAACRQVLTDPNDIDDSFQTTFVVLLKNAKRLDASSPLGGWLFGVAHRVSVRCRSAAHRRRDRETEAAKRSRTAIEQPDLSWREASAILHEELNTLPEKYRLPLLLCCVQGLTRDEAVKQLNSTVGAIRGQLERGRTLLAKRLTKRGITFSAMLIGSLMTMNRATATPSAELIEHTLRATAGNSNLVVAALARGVFPMTQSFHRIAMPALLLFAVLGLGLGAIQPQPAANAEEKLAAAKEVKPEIAPDNVTIRVLDPEGKPVEGATVYRHRHSFLDVSSIAEVAIGKTDAAGNLVAERGLFNSFHAAAEGYCAGASDSNERSDSIAIRLSKPFPIKGRLVDLQGKPISKAKVIVESVVAAENDDLTAAYNAYRVNPENIWGALPIQLDGKVTGAPNGTTTDADGRFELKNVGRLRVVHLRFEADGIEVARAVVFADPEFAKRMKPPTDAEKKIGGMSGSYHATTYGPEFTHAARPDHVITGTVTDALTGKPVRGAKVAGTTSHIGSAFLGNPWHDKVETTTDADGKFRLPGLVKAKSRTLHVMGSDTAPYLDHIVEVADTVDSAPVTLDVKLQPAVVVRGILVNKATGKPVAGSAQWLPRTANEPLLKADDDDTRLYTSQLGNSWPSGTRAVAAADGLFSLRVPSGAGVILGRCDLFDSNAIFTPARVREEDRKLLRKTEKDPNAIEAGPRDREGEEFFDTIMLITPLRWENGYAIIDPETKAKTIEVKIEFDPGSTVKLNATDPDGKPISGVTLVGPGNYGFRPPTFTKSEIAIGGIDTKGRPIQLYLLHKERMLCAAVTVKGDEKRPVAVKMRPCGSVTGKVVDHTGKPVKGAQVRLQMIDSVADDLLRQKLLRGENEVATDADGKFTFPRMFPDVEFDLYVNLPGLGIGTGSQTGVKLKAGEAKDVGEIKLRDPKKIDDE